MTEPTDALLPCPFCGEAAKHSFNSLYGDMSMASCKSCGATAYAPKWNRRAVLAKWGQPAQAAEPVAWLRNTTDPQPHAVTNLKFRSAVDAKAGVEYIPVFAAPQPVAREQLTGEQIQDLLLCGDPTDEEMRLIRIGWDAAHGIKGGQHVE